MGGVQFPVLQVWSPMSSQAIDRVAHRSQSLCLCTHAAGRMIRVRAHLRFQVCAGAAYPVFTVQGLRVGGARGHGCCGEFSKQPLSASIFSFCFQEIPPIQAPTPPTKKAPVLSHSPAWFSPKNPAADPVPQLGASATLVPALVPGTLFSLSPLLTV